jgi:FMN reductase
LRRRRTPRSKPRSSTGAVYANNDHYSDVALTDEGVIERLDELARAVIEFAERVPRELVGARPPHIPRRALAQP